MSVNSDITKVKGVGPAAKELLEKLGIFDIETLLLHYPRDWEDRSRPLALMDWKLGKVCTEITVVSQKWFGFGKTRTLKVYIEDESNKVFGTPACLVCFNRSFLQKTLVSGKRFRLYGSFIPRYGEIQSTSFELEAADERGSSALGAILPVYPLTSGLNQNALRKIMSNAVKEFAPNIKDELPLEIIKRYGFLHKADAIKALHFPSSFDELGKAKMTIIYEELFSFQMMIALRSQERKNAVRPSADIANNGSLTPLQQRLVERLPFKLTAGQLTSIMEMNRDMDGKYQMARLLQGDVGSGKTLVSFLAALKTIENGAQAVLMAPTELLARQHGDNAAKLLEPIGIRIAYLSGNLKAAGRGQLLKALAAGEIDMLVGTHALFSKDVVYKNLRFVAVDEQHRFGVLQRKAIMDKGGEIPPDFLMMSATPIPQSLALTVFGDLDVSVIKDMPPGRKAIKTHLASESNANKVYDFVRRELNAGRQAYFVYPLINGGDDEDDADDSELKNAVSMADKLSKEIFPGIKLGLLHSKVEDESKRKIMEAFHNGDIKILAATSVVEVGVDVPNASCMVIEHAERFGLAALHQLRGRVGRGSDQSYCFLVYSGKLTEDAKLRLKIMLENNDGFVIAEEDLKLRGPGHIAGIEQSGYLKFGMADLVLDKDVLAQARQDALEMILTTNTKYSTI